MINFENVSRGGGGGGGGHAPNSPFTSLTFLISSSSGVKLWLNITYFILMICLDNY